MIRTRHYCQFLSERQAKPTITFQGPGRQLDRAVATGGGEGGGSTYPPDFDRKRTKSFSFSVSSMFLRLIFFNFPTALQEVREGGTREPFFVRNDHQGPVFKGLCTTG